MHVPTFNRIIIFKQWDESDYGGIGVLRLPPDKVWKPDIVLFNNADGNYEVHFKTHSSMAHISICVSLRLNLTETSFLISISGPIQIKRSDLPERGGI